jgi:hypothetical protein
MARKRLIAPQFFLHGELFDAERDSGLPIRLAFAGLWGQADRRGIFEWKPRELKLCVLPYDVCDFAAVLETLEARGFVVRYTVDGTTYGKIPSLKRWQTFHHKETESDAPDMPIADAQLSLDIPKPRPTLGNTGANPRSTPGEPRANPTVTVTVTGTGTVASTEAPPADRASGGVNAEQQRAAFQSVAHADELAALERLLADHPTPAVMLGALYGIGTGNPAYAVTGEHNKRAATLADVARALGQFAVVGKPFSVPLFRGFVKRVIDQPPSGGPVRGGGGVRAPTTPEPPMRGELTPDGRIVLVPLAPSDDSEDAEARRRAASAAAVAAFRSGKFDRAAGRLFAGGSGPPQTAPFGGVS